MSALQELHKGQCKGRKRCRRCTRFTALSDFEFVRSLNKRHSWCRACKLTYDRERYWRDNPQAKFRSQRRAALKALPAAPLRDWLVSATSRKKRRYSLSPAWIAQWSRVRRCPVLGTTFVLGIPRDPLSPSLDRIDSALPYTDDNTRVVSLFVNVAKNALPEKRFRRLVCMAADNMRRPN